MTDKLNFEVLVSEENGVIVAVIKGPVDSATLDLFQEKVGQVCTRPGVKVLLDCRDMSYVNSRAIGLLVKYHRGLMTSRGRMALCCLNEKLVRTLDLLQIGKTLSIFSTREEAMAAWK